MVHIDLKAKNQGLEGLIKDMGSVQVQEIEEDDGDDLLDMMDNM
jgi:hypothetical protein